MENEIPEEIKSAFEEWFLKPPVPNDNSDDLALYNAIVNHARKGYVTEAECQDNINDASEKGFTEGKAYDQH